MEQVRCNYCGSDSYRERFELPDYMLGTPGRTTLVECRNCGLVYQNPRMTQSELEAHYPPAYDSFQPPAPDASTSLASRLRRYGQRKRVRIATAQEKSAGRLLDIGCASGAFLASLPSGWEGHGVETNRQAAETGRRAGLTIFHGSLEQAEFPEAYFDVVTLWDALEHLPDPAGSLREIHRILKPKGTVIVRVPNLSSWEASFFGRYWAGLDAPRHLYVFEIATLRKMLVKTGFSPGEMAPGIGLYPAFLLSVRFWLRGDPSRKRGLGWLLSILENPVTRALASPWFFWLGHTRLAGWVVLKAKKAHKDG